MTEQVWAITDTDGNVLNIIVADQEFADNLATSVDDPDTDTGDIPAGVQAYDITDVTDSDGYRPSIYHRRESDGTWVLLPEIVESNARAAALVAEVAEHQSARDAETARLQELRDKVGPGKPGLTQDERDELNLIMLSRNT